MKLSCQLVSPVSLKVSKMWSHIYYIYIYISYIYIYISILIYTHILGPTCASLFVACLEGPETIYEFPVCRYILLVASIAIQVLKGPKIFRGLQRKEIMDGGTFMVRNSLWTRRCDAGLSRPSPCNHPWWFFAIKKGVPIYI